MKLHSVCRIIVHVVLALMLATEALGQAQWDAVQALSAGQAVKVRLMKKGSVKGTLVSVTQTAMTVATKKGEVATARSDSLQGPLTLAQKEAAS